VIPDYLRTELMLLYYFYLDP